MKFPDVESDTRCFCDFYAYMIVRAKKRKYGLKCLLTDDIVLNGVTHHKIKKWFLNNYVIPKTDDFDKLIMIK